MFSSWPLRLTVAFTFLGTFLLGLLLGIALSAESLRAAEKTIQEALAARSAALHDLDTLQKALKDPHGVIIRPPLQPVHESGW